MMPHGMRVDHSLVFDPGVFKSAKKPSKLQTSPLVTKPITARRWATPRFGIVSAANYLTQRSLRDLPSQARFERSTPDGMRQGQISAEFVEYLMGYPIGWTEFTEEVQGPTKKSG